MFEVSVPADQAMALGYSYGTRDRGICAGGAGFLGDEPGGVGAGYLGAGDHAVAAAGVGG